MTDVSKLPLTAAALSALSAPAESSSDVQQQRKRKPVDDSTLAALYSVNTEFKCVLSAQYQRPSSNAESELVVLEIPWINTLRKLPATLYRHRYGSA